MNEELKWEMYNEAPGAITERLKVEGGYLYHLTPEQR